MIFVWSTVSTMKLVEMLDRECFRKRLLYYSKMYVLIVVPSTFTGRGLETRSLQHIFCNKLFRF